MQRYAGEEWLCLPELRIGTGYGKDAEQRLDLFVMHLHPSKANVRYAFEIKTSRKDFLHEIRHREKRMWAMRYSNRFYFAMPKGLIGLDELPLDSGLFEYDEEQKRLWLKWEAPQHDTFPPSWKLLASIARHIRRTPNR